MSIERLAAIALHDALASDPHAVAPSTKKADIAAAGSPLGNASKMPCATYGISAFECKTGGKLGKVEGSICSTCYALKGNYVFAGVKRSHAARLAALTGDVYAWRAAMASLIRRDGRPFFRWHDSGDVQSLEHLHAIAWVARATTGVKHWLPTKEYGLVREYLTLFGAFPANLTVRVSAPMIDQDLPASLRKLGLPYSTAHTAEPPADGIEVCRAYDGEGPAGCGDCRACWDPAVTVSYRVH